MIAGLSLEWISSEELQIFFTPFSKKLLVSDAAKFIWTTLPFASLVFIKKHKR
jgi:hypothetical protein